MSDSKHESPESVRSALSGRRVLITGANRGIGHAVARHFAAQGARLVVQARADASELAASLGAVAGVTGDLRDPALPDALAAAVASLGGLDVLVLNAAVLGPIGPMEALSREAFAEVMAINVEAQLAIFSALCPALLNASPGVVIWMSSGLGRFALPGYGAYCASKHAVEGLSKLAHAEYGDRGLISVTVSPGMVQTDMLRTALGTDDVSQHTPPDAVARAFERLVVALTPGHGGMALEISDF